MSIDTFHSEATALFGKKRKTKTLTAEQMKDAKTFLTFLVLIDIAADKLIKTQADIRGGYHGSSIKRTVTGANVSGGDKNVVADFENAVDYKKTMMGLQTQDMNESTSRQFTLHNSALTNLLNKSPKLVESIKARADRFMEAFAHIQTREYAYEQGTYRDRYKGYSDLYETLWRDPRFEGVKEEFTAMHDRVVREALTSAKLDHFQSGITQRLPRFSHDSVT